MHSAEWDTEYDYKGKKVALIGSGASSVQIGPAIVNEVNQLYVFQRTPNWLFPRFEGPYPQWYKNLLKKFPFIMKFNFWSLWLEMEVYTLLYTRKSWTERAMRWFLKRSIRRQLNGDETLIEKMTPKYEIGCKRILTINDYLPMFVNNSNAHLISEPIEEFTETGIKAKGQKEITLDLVILATGFKIEDSICGFEIVGKDGIDLRNQFDDFPAAFNGISVPNFPNLSLLLGPNTVLGHNSITFMIECQTDYVISCLKQMVCHSIQTIEVKREKTLEFRDLMDKLSLTRNFTGSCRSWYKKDKDGINFVLWPSNLFHYWWITYKARLLENYWMTFEKTDKNVSS